MEGLNRLASLAHVQRAIRQNPVHVEQGHLYVISNYPRAGPHAGRHVISKLGKPFTRESIRKICSRNGSRRSNGSALGPSHFAWVGSGWASKNKPAIPSAIPARANSSTCRRRPPDASSLAFLRWRLCVTSKMAGKIGRAHV